MNLALQGITNYSTYYVCLAVKRIEGLGIVGNKLPLLTVECLFVEIRAVVKWLLFTTTTLAS